MMSSTPTLRTDTSKSPAPKLSVQKSASPRTPKTSAVSGYPTTPNKQKSPKFALTKSVSRDTPRTQKVPSPISINNSSKSSFTQFSAPKSPLTAVWTNKSAGRYQSPISPRTWRVSPVSPSRKKLVSQPAIDYTPERDPLFREAIPRQNNNLETITDPMLSLSVDKRKNEDPILISMRNKENGPSNDDVNESDKPKAVKLLRQIFENTGSINGSANRTMESKEVSRNSRKTRYEQRKSTKRSHTVIGLNYETEINESKLSEKLNSKNIRRSSFSEIKELDVKDDYVMPSVRSLLMKFETNRKKSFKKLKKISMEKPDRSVLSEIPSSSNQTTELQLKSEPSSNESRKIEDLPPLSPQETFTTTMDYDETIGVTERECSNSYIEAKNNTSFQRNTKSRSSVKNLLKRFENANKKQQLGESEKQQNHIEVSSGLAHTMGDASCSTPKKIAEIDELMPTEVILCDEKAPISPIGVDELGLENMECRTPQNPIGNFSRRSASRSSVKDLRKRFEASRNQKAAITDVDQNTIETKKRCPKDVWVKEDITKEICSVKINPSLHSEKVKNLRQSFLEQTMISKTESQNQVRKIHIYLNDYSEDTITSPDASRDMSKIIGLFENKESDNSASQSKSIITVNKLNLSKYTTSHSKDTYSHSEGSDEEPPSLPNRPPPTVNKLDIKKFTDALSGDPEDNNYSTKREKASSVSKLNLDEYRDALSHSNSETVLNTTVDQEVVQKAKVSNLVDQFADSLPNFMTGSSEDKRHDESYETHNEKDISIEITGKNSNVSATRGSQITVPGKLRPLNSSELKFFGNGGGAENNLLSMFRSTSKDEQMAVATSPQIQRVKNVEQPFQRRCSLKLPRNCRELNSDEKDLFFGGNVTPAFMKSKGVRRSSSDISELSSHKKSLLVRPDFHIRGKGNGQMYERKLEQIDSSESVTNGSGLDRSFLREVHSSDDHISIEDVDWCIRASSSPKLDRSLSDPGSNVSLDYIMTNSATSHTFAPISFAPSATQSSIDQNLVQNISDDKELSYLSDCDYSLEMGTNDHIIAKTGGKQNNTKITTNICTQKNAHQIIEENKTCIDGNLQSKVTDNIKSNISTDFTEMSKEQYIEEGSCNGSNDYLPQSDSVIESPKSAQLVKIAMLHSTESPCALQTFTAKPVELNYDIDEFLPPKESNIFLKSRLPKENSIEFPISLTPQLETWESIIKPEDSNVKLESTRELTESTSELTESTSELTESTSELTESTTDLSKLTSVSVESTTILARSELGDLTTPKPVEETPKPVEETPKSTAKSTNKRVMSPANHVPKPSKATEQAKSPEESNIQMAKSSAIPLKLTNSTESDLSVAVSCSNNEASRKSSKQRKNNTNINVRGKSFNVGEKICHPEDKDSAAKLLMFDRIFIFDDEMMLIRITSFVFWIAALLCAMSFFLDETWD